MSMTNGLYYSSKAELRKEYKQAGVVEIGTESQVGKRKRPPPDTEGIRKAIKTAAQKAGVL